MGKLPLATGHVKGKGGRVGRRGRDRSSEKGRREGRGRRETGSKEGDTDVGGER